WLYTGLATVPGAAYRCATCGLERRWPIQFKVTGMHLALDTQRRCKGKLELFDSGEHVRAALPKSGRGEKRAYDAYAKKIMYLVGCQFEKLGRRQPYG